MLGAVTSCARIRRVGPLVSAATLAAAPTAQCGGEARRELRALGRCELCVGVESQPRVVVGWHRTIANRFCGFVLAAAAAALGEVERVAAFLHVVRDPPRD